MTPMIGSHSVIESPEPVSRVAPPTTTRPKTTSGGRERARSPPAATRCGSFRACHAVLTPRPSAVAARDAEPYAFRMIKARVRKAIGGVGILVFLGAYIWAAASIGSALPNQWAVRLVYMPRLYVVGTAWGLPIIPLITWMNREP